MTFGNQIKHQITHLVKVQVPIVEAGILVIHMGLPGIPDILRTDGAGAQSHAEDFSGKSKLLLMSLQNGLAKLMLVQRLPTGLPVEGKAIVLFLLKCILGQVSPLHGQLVQEGHQFGQGLPGSLLKGYTSGLPEPLGILPIGLMFSLGGVDIVDPVEGVSAGVTFLAQQDQGPPGCLLGYRSAKLRQDLIQGIALGVPAAKSHLRFIQKRAQKHPVFCNGADMGLFCNHNREQMDSPPYPSPNREGSLCSPSGVNPEGI